MKSVSLLHSSACVALLGAALLSACASTGGLHSTATPLAADSLHSQQSLAGTALSASAWPRPDWWKTAGDPQLDELVATALADNPDMALADARVQAALAAAGAADAAREPTLNANASISGLRAPPMLPPLATGHLGWIRYGYLDFKWDLDLWGGKRAAWEAAVGEARAAAVDAQGARLELSTDVVQAYFDLAGAYAQRDLAGAELQRAEDFLKLTQRLVANGIANKLSLAQLESETASDRVHLKAAENAVRTSGLVLAALLGKGPDYALGIRRPTLPALPTLVLPSDIPADLLGRRPDVVAARWRVEAASRGIQAAKTQFLPNISIGSLAGLIAPTSMNLFALPNRFYTISPALSLPLFEGGALRANLSGKDATRDLAVAQYNHTLVQAINQVAAQVDDLRSLTSQVNDAETAQQSAAQAYRLSMLRFRAGIGSFLEALSVREELITAEQQLAGLQLQRSNAWAALNEQLGGGFQPATDAPALTSNASTPRSADKAQP